MLCDLTCSVKDADGGFRSGDKELSADGGGRDGVIVQVETDIDGLAAADRNDVPSKRFTGRGSS